MRTVVRATLAFVSADRPLAPFAWRAAFVLMAAVLCASTTQAQVRVPRGSGRPPAGATTRPPSRTPTDTGKVADTALVHWADTDSVMEALMARPGYAVTRYQGNTVQFVAGERALSLVGHRAAVGRGEVLVVGDTIVYNDSLQLVTALGDTNTLRDPSQGEDIVSRGRIKYDIRRQTGTVTNISTAVTQGERWILHGGVAAIARDTSAARHDAYYVKGGDITSCDDTIPHYHFRATQMKVVAGNVIVARPAVLYIMDIPVMVLPFLFADLSRGRHSGILTPRFGIAELVRNSPGYRRKVDNLGYYWDINHYLDASAWVNWLSNARPNVSDNLLTSGAPGYFDYNGELNYRWIDRFMQGSLAFSDRENRDGSNGRNVSWNHSQDFSLTSHLRMNLNYSTNTSARLRTETNPFAQFGTIYSSLNYENQYGPLQLSLGGTRTQYPGRSLVRQSYPSLSISPRGAISLGDVLTWTPTFSFNVDETLKDDQTTGSPFVLRSTTSPFLGAVADSSRLLGGTRNVTAQFNTPIRLFDFELANSFSFTDVVQHVPQPRLAFSGPADSVGQARTFAEYTESGVNWDFGFGLPRFSQGKLNLTPSVSFANVGDGPLFFRSTLSNGQWVRQNKRPSFALSAAPTIYGLFPGFGPFSRFRHAINPTVTFSYAPAASVPREFLQARGQGTASSLVGIAQNNVSLGLNTNIEAKFRAGSDTASTESEARKIQLLQLNFDGLSYNFQQYKERRRRAQEAGAALPNAFVGLNTDAFGYSASSELLPGFQLRQQFSLFTVNPAQFDTAQFKPYLTTTSISFSINRQTSFIAALARVFGAGSRVNEDASQARRSTTGDPAGVVPDTETRRAGALPVAGSYARDQQFNVPTGRGFQASFAFSSQRSRPIPGIPALTAVQLCAPLAVAGVNPITLQNCIDNPSGYPGALSQPASYGIPTFRAPSVTTLSSNTSFNITPKWAATWATDYDFVNHRFGSQIVNLQRELHDWRAVFGFSQSPTGSFAFTFFISLNAEPDLKFNYDRTSYPTTLR